MAQPLGTPYSYFTDANGTPLAGGKVYTYTAGTTTPLASYTDSTGTTPASNPVILDSAGRATIWLSGFYKITVKDANDVLIKETDNISAYGLTGDMLKATYDAANIQEQLVGLTSVQTLTNKELGSGCTANELDLSNPVITLTTGNIITNADNGSTGCSIQYYHNSASPAVSDIQQISWASNNSSATKVTFGLIRNVVDDITASSEDGRLDFQTIIAGTIATRMKVGQGLVVGTPTGDDKGAGTINAVAVYDDNVLLTCYVFDQAVEGGISLDKWDSKVPARENEVRIHESARKFKTRIGTTHDPLTLDGYAAHWKEKKHLTSMPNEENFDPVDGMAMGSWVQRLIETVEIQAVLIEQLNQKLKTIEASLK